MKWGHLPKEQVDEIMRRRFICTQCPFMSRNATSSSEYFNLKGKHYTTRREDEHCSLCGCGIEGKTASLAATCGAESWNTEHPEKQVEVKWTKFDKDGKR